ncbi:MAG: polysaccharide biosynthesis protein [Bacteroidetes bacterium]|nr:polysaccharide biosynthesis protein [Bacteroidota bacterium]MBT3749878.1 polysaccharide biosynthesis protein [Bacteroidota bacterium]MBT4398408.1 polysaccharide biosynthesis protein [Bacteroidota bacterium]MBT4411830.1 polysaccharide biosynthesis protein [Bacteroidota bacterium]
MKQIRQLAGQTAIYGAGTILPKFLNWIILTPFYTRIFVDQADYGSITELYAYVVILNVIVTFGMETGFFRFSQQNNSFRSVYTTAFLVVLVLATILVSGVNLFIKPLSELIRYEENWQYLSWFSIIVAVDCLAAIPFAKLRREERAKRFTILKLANISVNLLLIIFFLKLWPALYESHPDAWFTKWYDPELKVGYVFLANLITSISVLVLISGELRFLGGPLKKSILRDLLKYSAPLVIVGIAGAINEVADKIFLKFLLPESDSAMKEVGQYGASYRIAVIMTLFVQMFRYAFEPFLFARKKKDGTEIYSQIMNLFVGMGLALFLFTVFYLDIFKVFLGPNYHEGLEVVPLILLANLFVGVFYNLSVWYKLSDLTRYGAVLAIGGSFVTIAANFILIPRIGYMGSAWATILCYFSMMLGSYLWGRKVMPIPYKIWDFLMMLLVALVMFAVHKWIDPGTDLIKYSINTVMLLSFLVLVNWRTGLMKIFFVR